VSAAAAALSILSAEGYAAEKYRQTPAGQAEERRAKQEGAALYRVARENILRPGVLGGLVGIGECCLHIIKSTLLLIIICTVNTAVLGTVSFYAYKYWDLRQWDRRVVSAVSVGLLTLWTGEGFVLNFNHLSLCTNCSGSYIAERYRQTHH
jgi:hypothetical protein